MSGLLQDHATRAAESRADATAVVLDDERLSYGELERDCGPGDLCLPAPKRPAAILAMHAALKAGGAYVGEIDRRAPRERFKA